MADTRKLQRRPTRWVGPAIAAVLAYFVARWALAMPRRSRAPGDTSDDAGKRGSGPGGTPKPDAGGVTRGRERPGVSYQVPEGWDPVRGLWISPDCVWVVEGPGWWNGLCLGPDGYQVCNLTYGPGGFPASAPNSSLAGSGGTVAEHIASDPSAGALGFVDARRDQQPEDIARAILEEYSPLCSDVPTAEWSPALQGWYQSLVDRIVDLQGSYLDVTPEEGFEPEGE